MAVGSTLGCLQRLRISWFMILQTNDKEINKLVTYENIGILGKTY